MKILIKTLKGKSFEINAEPSQTVRGVGPQRTHRLAEQRTVLSAMLLAVPFRCVVQVLETKGLIQPLLDADPSKMKLIFSGALRCRAPPLRNLGSRVLAHEYSPFSLGTSPLLTARDTGAVLKNDKTLQDVGVRALLALRTHTRLRCVGKTGKTCSTGS